MLEGDIISALPDFSNVDLDIQSIVPEKFIFTNQRFGCNVALEIPINYWPNIKVSLFQTNTDLPFAPMLPRK